MMSCVFDDGEISSSSNSSFSMEPNKQQQHRVNNNNNKEKLNFKSRFIKKKTSVSSAPIDTNNAKVQRSASAIFRYFCKKTAILGQKKVSIVFNLASPRCAKRGSKKKKKCKALGHIFLVWLYLVS